MTPEERAKNIRKQDFADKNTLIKIISAEIQKAIEQEREECAKLAESLKCSGSFDDTDQFYMCGPEIADAIRKRVEK